MFANITGWHLIIVLAVILLLFGAAKLPALAKSAGQSARLFKGEMKAMRSESETGSVSVGESATAVTTPRADVASADDEAHRLP